MTGGSCASAAWSYIAQKQGLDVRDFRGGRSRDFFSNTLNLNKMSKMNGIKALTAEGGSPATVGNRLLKKCEEGREYYLCVGRHAAIVRRNEGRLQYLELQSQYLNGWRNFDAKSPRKTLMRRFGCSSASDGGISEMFDFMIDIKESDFSTKEFQSLMGHINTEVSAQRKGAAGFAK